MAERVFAGRANLHPSGNDYDWLGHGIYFWESNPARALAYAQSLRRWPQRTRGTIRHPTVVGAVIDLGFCMNLLDAQFLRLLRDGYERLVSLTKEAGLPLPVNRAIGGSKDVVLRNLDCAVIETVHQIRQEQHVRAFDSVRGVLVEGAPLYPGAGFNDRNHIQICVRNVRCIQGYFRVLKEPANAPNALLTKQR